MVPASFQSSGEILLWKGEGMTEFLSRHTRKPQVFQQKAGEWEATTEAAAPEPGVPSSPCCANSSFWERLLLHFSER